MMTHPGRDLRYAVRILLRTPRFTVPAVVALALGIGATSAIFSVVRGVMLEPLPYRDPDRVVSIWETNVRRGQLRGIVAPANFQAWRERSRSFQHLGLVGPARLNVLLDGQPYEVSGMLASADVFAALGVQPVLGRTYTPDEDLRGNDAVILLSHRFWQSRFGGRPEAVGGTLTANGAPRTIVGVMPPDFTIEGQRADFYVPYGWTIEDLRAARGRGISHAVARLRDDVTVEQASEEMARIAAELEKEAPQRNAGRSITLVPIHAFTTETARPALLVLSGAVALVLLIACVNVANLLLARTTVRQRELGVRSALGASRGRLVRQMLAESLVLALLGGSAGLALAAAFHRGLLALVADRIPVPRIDQVALDLPVVGFTLVTMLATGFAFGLVPAIVATAGAGDALREGGRHGAGPRARRMLGALVVVEVALSLVLLAGAGLLIRSFARLQSVHPGFQAEGVLTARVALPGTRYPEGRDATAFFDRAVSGIRSRPGVDSAAAISYLPMAGPGIGTSFYRLDRARPADGQLPSTEVRPVTPEFFRTMGIPLIAGRDFTHADREDSPLVALVSEGLARQHFENEDPIGRRLQVSVARSGGIQVEIVGVVGDIRFASLERETRTAIYLPHSQLSAGHMTFVVRARVDPRLLVSSVAAVVRDLDPGLPLADVKTMEEVVGTTLARPRALSVLLTAFALIALILAGVGVYGVTAYSVSQRTQEIGIRIALGATAGAVFRMVLGQALRLVAAGAAAGLIAAGMSTRLLQALLFETAPVDVVTFTATTAVLVLVASAASLIPARRATRIAPVDALRVE